MCMILISRFRATIMVIHSPPLGGGALPPLIFFCPPAPPLTKSRGGIGAPLKKNPNITGDKIILQVYLEDCQMVINSDSITNMLYI